MTPAIVAWLDDGRAVVADVPGPSVDAPPHPVLRVAFERLNDRWRVGRFGPGEHDVTERCLRTLDCMAGFSSWADDPAAEPGEGLRRWSWWHGADHPLPANRLPGCRFLDDLRATAARGGRWPMPPDYDERNDR